MQRRPQDAEHRGHISNRQQNACPSAPHDSEQQDEGNHRDYGYPGSKSDVRTEANEPESVDLSNLEWEALTTLKQELIPDERRLHCGPESAARTAPQDCRTNSGPGLLS